MDLGIDGLRVIVTAGASGIGLEIARAFVREGARVHVGDVDAGALARLHASDPAIGRSVCDVASRDDVARLFDEATATLGGLDCLVNNAGIAGPTGRVDEIDPAQWDRCLAVDLTGQFNCVRLAVPLLRRSANASILNVSSLAGRLGFPLRTPYAAAKWGVVGLSRSLAAELGGDGIRVNALLPGVVAGERQQRVLEAKARARHHLRGDGAPGFLLQLAQGVRHPAAARRRRDVRGESPRPHDLGPGAVRVRRHEHARVSRGKFPARH
jgi:NAD(P)-dependent dehydrogenase (short-subunit alcohol dehydrogenase family)